MARSDGETVTLTISKIKEANTRKFFNKSDKGYLIIEDIMKQLPEEDYNHHDACLSQQANSLLPYYSYNHKIKLVSSSQMPLSWNCLLSLIRLRVWKRWLDDNLVKGFIRPLKSSITSPILLVQ
jgi:hypothetical protein